jgi:hypothetical protein
MTPTWRGWPLGNAYNNANTLPMAESPPPMTAMSWPRKKNPSQRFRGQLPCEVVVTAVTHPLHGCRLRA